MLTQSTYPAAFNPFCPVNLAKVLRFILEWARTRSMKTVATSIMFCIILLLTACWQKDVGRSFYPSGKIRTEATVANGLLNGSATMYYENGTKMGEANYRAGLINGKATSFYENGVKKAEAEYTNGVLNGISISWDEKGAEKSRAKFLDGALQQ
jgi:major membrane immunogen (membrane-anchored lipoprotein)